MVINLNAGLHGESSWPHTQRSASLKTWHPWWYWNLRRFFKTKTKDHPANLAACQNIAWNWISLRVEKPACISCHHDVLESSTSGGFRPLERRSFPLWRTHLYNLLGLFSSSFFFFFFFLFLFSWKTTLHKVPPLFFSSFFFSFYLWDHFPFGVLQLYEKKSSTVSNRCLGCEFAESDQGPLMLWCWICYIRQRAANVLMVKLLGKVKVHWCFSGEFVESDQGPPSVLVLNLLDQMEVHQCFDFKFAGSCYRYLFISSLARTSC